MTHGYVAGIVMLDSTSTRIPGDPGHAATFDFPVCYATAKGMTVADLLTHQPARLAPAIAAARELEEAGVSFVAADCGLFSIYQSELAAALQVPFAGSALSLVPLLASTLAPETAVGVITGHREYLSSAHLAGAGIDPRRVAVAGMEACPEFRRVVLEGALDPALEALADEVVDTCRELVSGGRIGALVLECSNLATYRMAIQEACSLPVFDMVTLIELLADGHRRRVFPSPYQPGKARQLVS